MAAIRDEIPEWKMKTFEEVKGIFTKYPVVGIIQFRDVTAGQMQEIRRKFRDIGVIKVTKNTIIEKALDSVDNDFSKLKDYLGDQVAIVGSDINPFKLYREIESTKIPSPLKAGQISPIDVVVEKGPTSFPPGPIIGDLQGAGLPAAIEKGKIVIKNTTTVVKAGETVSRGVAKGLSMLDIKPVRVGLDVRVMIDSGTILFPDSLKIDFEELFRDFTGAYQRALNLAVNSAYVIPETAEILLAKAFMDAKNLAVNAGIFEKEAIGDIVARSYSDMLSLASLLPDEALDDELSKKLEGVAKVASTASTFVEENEEAEAETKEEEEKEEEEEEKEEEEEEKEEEAAEGLGALFG